MFIVFPQIFVSFDFFSRKFLSAKIKEILVKIAYNHTLITYSMEIPEPEMQVSGTSLTHH